MMNCNEVTQSASAFLERQLRFRKRLEFILHIAMCRGCRAYLDQLRLTILGLHSLKRPAGTGNIEEIVRKFRDEHDPGHH